MPVTRLVQWTVLGLTAFVVTISFMGSRIQGDVSPVVLSGNPAPGTANGRITSVVGGASVNASGDMAFMTNLDVGGIASVGIFAIYGGVFSPVALEGQPLPDSSGRFFGGGLGQPQINNNGDIVFVSNFASNSSGAGFGWGVFLFSSGTLRKVADAATVAPGMSGQMAFGAAQINDNRDIAFVAGGPPYSSAATLFLMSQGTLTSIVSQPSFNNLAMNNRGDIAFRDTQHGISEYSGGTIRLIVGPGNGFSAGDQADDPSINDDGDIVFVDYALVPQGRGGTLVPVAGAVRRWRQGVVDKIVAAGDPVPGIPGATFRMDFRSPEINESGIVFGSSTAPAAGQNVMGIICRFQNGALSLIAREDQPVSGLGTLNRIGNPSFDNRLGALTTFVANPGILGITTGPQGIFAATTAGQFPLVFPQIADGTTADGGWRTKFILANQSTATSPGQQRQR